MNDWKGLLSSRTIQMGIASLLTMLAGLVGIQVADGAALELVSTVVLAINSVLTALMMLYRAVATKRLVADAPIAPQPIARPVAPPPGGVAPKG